MSSSSGRYDVVIVGGGMVGSMLAAALAQNKKLRLAVIEQQYPQPFKPGTNPDYDIRVSALSIATQRMFENVNAWSGVVARRACAYSEMLVWDGEEHGSTHFKASEQLALQDVVQSSSNVDYYCPASLQSYRHVENHIVCLLSGTDSTDDSALTLTTRLLVGADGAQSSVRDMAGIATQRSVYPQHALVASIETELPEQHITWQRFKPTGPEAFLPLCGSRASMVWYHSAEEVKRLRELDDAAFIDAMQSSFPDRLGGIKRVLSRGSFPIAKAHALQYIEQRVALIGDAAHTVHPLAGQGVNLGMLDAAALAQLVDEAAMAGKDIGSARLLRRYERWRRSDNAAMISLLDGFYHAFKPQPQPVRRLRSAALGVADRAGPLKKFVMRYAMGTSGDLPQLARRQLVSYQESDVCQS